MGQELRLDGRVTPAGVTCPEAAAPHCLAGTRVDQVLQTPHPDTIKQGAQENLLDFLPDVRSSFILDCFSYGSLELLCTNGSKYRMA